MATKLSTQVRERTLRSLSGVGPIIEADLHRLGIQSVDDLAKADGTRLYHSLCEVTGTRQDPCVLDTFRCAVAQAKDPFLPKEQTSWWWWSRQRKAGLLSHLAEDHIAILK
jgi:predicted RecB family nuclease